VERLREALNRDPPDADDLAAALDEARRADVDPLLFAAAEERFLKLIEKQETALALVKAVDGRMIERLRKAITWADQMGMQPDEFPGKDGVGVLSKAKQALHEEELRAMQSLKESMQVGGACHLKRAVSQAKEVEGKDDNLIVQAEVQLQEIAERKRRIGLLKHAMASNNATLLRSAIEECERGGVGYPEIDVQQAKNWLAQLGNYDEANGSQEKLRNAAFCEPAGKVEFVASDHALVRQTRAKAGLTAALYQDSPDAYMLKLALKEAIAANCTGEDVNRAQEFLDQEGPREVALDRLKHGEAARDIVELRLSVSRCRELGVDPKKILHALMHLIDEQTRVARMAGDHGLGNIVLTSMEKERLDLHNSIHGGLRAVCRVMRRRTEEQGPDLLNKPPVARVDRHTVSIDGIAFRLGACFGPDSIETEIFDEVRGLVQSALDGFNVLLMTCGPVQAGKTYTMRGQEGVCRGVLPRSVDELFSICSRDEWRIHTEIDMQIVAVQDARCMADILGVRSAAVRDRQRPGPAARLVARQPTLGFPKSGMPSGSVTTARLAPSIVGPGTGSLAVVIDGAATRRVTSKAEFKQLVDDAYHHLKSDSVHGHVLFMVHLSRTNRATGAMSRSKLVFADLAGIGEGARHDTVDAYNALRAVITALAEGERRVPF
jgi:hypothetical protein